METNVPGRGAVVCLGNVVEALAVAGEEKHLVPRVVVLATALVQVLEPAIETLPLRTIVVVLVRGVRAVADEAKVVLRLVWSVTQLGAGRRLLTKSNVSATVSGSSCWKYPLTVVYLMSLSETPDQAARAAGARATKVVSAEVFILSLFASIESIESDGEVSSVQVRQCRARGY